MKKKTIDFTSMFAHRKTIIKKSKESVVVIPREKKPAQKIKKEKINITSVTIESSTEKMLSFLMVIQFEQRFTDTFRKKAKDKKVLVNKTDKISKTSFEKQAILKQKINQLICLYYLKNAPKIKTISSYQTTLMSFFKKVQ
jgi:hypothetical protein